MIQAGKQFLRDILLNPDTGRTLLAEGDNEDIGYKKDVVTGRQLEQVGLLRWRAPGGNEEFVLHGVEISDGLSSRVYTPAPDNLFRFRFASGKSFFGLIKDGAYL